MLQVCRSEALDNLTRYQLARNKGIGGQKKKTPHKELNEGDLVLNRTARTEGKGKVESKWEGTLVSTKKISPKSYRLASQMGGRTRAELERRQP